MVGEGAGGFADFVEDFAVCESFEVVVKGAVVFCDLEENFGVFDAGFDFAAVADDLFVV